MRKDCEILRNYDKSKDKVRLPHKIAEISTFEEVFVLIKEDLENGNYPFSLEEESSSDPNNFNKAMVDLVDSIVDLMAEVLFKDKEVDFKQGSKNAQRLQGALYLLLSPDRTTRKLDLDIPAIIHPQDSNDALKSRRLDDLISKYFKGYTRFLYKLVIRERLAAISVIDTKNKKLVTNVYDLNRNIETFLHDNFITLIRYMKSVGSSKEWGYKKDFPNDLFNNKHGLIGTLDTYLNEFEYYIDYLKRTGELDDIIEDLYNSYVYEDKKNTDFLEALFSFLTIKYTNPIILDVLGKYISIDRDMDSPMEYDENGVLKYKYTFGKDTEGRVHGWGTEARDALKEMGNYSKLLISMIKLVDPETHKIKEDGELKVVDYFQTMTSLFNFIPQFTQYAENCKELEKVAANKERARFNSLKARNLINSLVNIAESPVENMRTIMTTLHEAIDTQYRKRERHPLMNVLESVFNEHEIRVLESVYYSVFDTSNPNSFYSIEHQFIEDNGFSQGYPIVESLVSLITASTQKNYEQTYWKKEDKRYYTNTKAKFNTDKMKFELANAMNILNQRNMGEYPYEILDKREQGTKEIYKINVNGIILKLEIPTSNNTYGLFTSKLNNTSVYVVEGDKETLIKEYLGKIKLDTPKLRKKTLNSNTGANKVLLDILKFIDTFTGTALSAGEDGLQRYSLLNRYLSNVITDMLGTAIKGFYINYLNKDYLDKVNADKYNGTDFIKYIEKEKAIFSLIWKLDTLRAKDIWKNTTRGLNLATGNTNLEWIENYAKVLQIMSGEISLSNIKNAEDNSIPNYGLTFVGSNVWSLIESRGYKCAVVDLQKQWDALKYNPFTIDPSMILATAVDEDVTLKGQRKRMIKAMTDSELYYHAIVDKFLIPLLDGRMIVLPTTYSDKTSFVNYIVNLKGKTDLTKLSSLVLEQYIVSSIGGMYNKVLDNVLRDYTLVYKDQLESITDRKEKIRKIEDIIKNKTEEQLTKDFTRIGLKLETDTHFRIINGLKWVLEEGKWKAKKTKKLAFNELLVNNVFEIYTTEGIKKRFLIEKRTLVRNLIESLTQFNTNGEGNPIMQAYNQFIGKENRVWINNNKLVIALDLNGNIINSLEDLEKAKSLTLNPLLDKFLMLHAYLGNNLRYILSGNELNHKNKTLASMPLGNRVILLYKKDTGDKEVTFISLIENNKDLKDAILSRIESTGSTVYEDEFNTLSSYWNSMSFEDLNYLMELVPKLKDTINKVKLDSLYEVEATSQGAQLKRNVIIPGTMRPYTLNSLKGIPSTFRVAVVNDTAAETFNISGDVKSDNDAHDGSAWICPITSILENWSLQENEVGTVKKPIWHDYNGLLGTAILVKFAAHTITNNIMRKAKNGINMLNVFRRMTNNNWEPLLNEDKNILNYNALTGSPITLTSIIGENDLLYKGKGGEIFNITSLDYIDGVYVTTELVYDAPSKQYSDEIIYYHYFDDEGNHIRSEVPINNSKYHTMHSIYEAYKVFGGLESGYLKSDGSFLESEASLYATAMLTNLVTIENTELVEKDMLQYGEALAIWEQSEKKAADKPVFKIKLDLDHYKLPLKTLMVDYIVNNSAIKNGAGNRNPNLRLYNNEQFDTIVLNTLYYGIQMDADHEADEAEMTEFSLVISALDAGGRLHDHIVSIYRALGDMAIRESLNEYNIIKAFLDAVNVNAKTPYIINLKDSLGITSDISDTFLLALDSNEDIKDIFKRNHPEAKLDNIIPEFNKAKEEYTIELENARDQLYTIIGSTIINNVASNRGLAGLTQAILRNIKSKFSLKSSHKLETELKIPFSDPNIYSNILTTFSSLITLKSIRRKYPGIGGVMSPAYDIMMVYDLNGKTYQYDDILKEATEFYNTIDELPEGFEILDDILDNTKWNDKLVLLYLDYKSLEYNLDKYYYTIPESLELPNFNYYTETFMPTDLIGIKYKDAEGNEKLLDINLNSIETYYEFKLDVRAFLEKRLGTPLFTIRGFVKNINKARNLAPTKVWWTYIDKNNIERTKNIYDTEEVKASFLNKDSSKVQALLNLLSTGKWTDSDGKIYDIKLYNTPAELIMSNIYQSRFNVGADVSLVDILDNKGKVFKDNVISQTKGIVERDFYDFIMPKSNGKHAYISFDRSLEAIDPDKEYSKISWGRKQRRPSSIASGKVVNDVYVLDKDLRPLFLIGRDIVRPDVKYNKSEDNYYLMDGDEYKKDEDGNPIILDRTNFTYDGEKVTEYIEFVKQCTYKRRVQVKDNNVTKNHFTYNIDTLKLKRTLFFEDSQGKSLIYSLKESDLYYDQIRELLKLLYQADSYECLTLNDNLYSIANSNLIKLLMKDLYKKFDYNKELSNFLFKMNEEVISRWMLTPTKKNGKWNFEISKDNKYGLVLGEQAVSIKQGLYGSQVAKLTREYYKNLGQRKRTSFMRSLRFTASRIPAQTLQSFMQMLLVGFTGEENNYTYVSHWLTWLQGSDYDIDKAYIMGLAFDDNGSYVGWSSLFDYYDIDTLYESEKLPLPRRSSQKGDPLILVDGGIDINPELKEITELNALITSGKDLEEKLHRLRRLKLYNQIFTKLGDNTRISKIDKSNEQAFNDLLNHFNTQYPPGMQSLILRNFISSHIQSTILDIRNFKDSYIPVDMEDLRKAADDSTKGLDAKTITLLNPLSIYKMQRQNMIGKGVIGIAATGQKAAFMLSYYFNEIYKNAKEGIDYTYEDGVFKVLPNSALAKTTFSFKSTRLINNTANEVNTLPTINLDNVIGALKEYAETHRLEPNKPVDIMISQLISAATDNAKELILDKINAGSNLAKCFLFGIVIGCDVTTLVLFMTSPVLSYVNALSNLNIYMGRERTVKLALNDVKKYLNTRSRLLNLGIEVNLTYNNILDTIVPKDLDITTIYSYLDDLLEFSNLLEAADEFSSLGRVLSVNLGIKTKAEDLEYAVANIRRIIEDREDALGIRNKGIVNQESLQKLLGDDYAKLKNFASDKFDVVKWLQDLDIILEDGSIVKYRLLTADYYNYIKKVFNVFEVINNLPHFSKMFTLMGSVFTVHGFSTRTRIVQEAVKLYRDLSPTNRIDSKGYGQILSAANDMMLIKFFEQSNIKFPLLKDYPMINAAGDIYRTKGTSLLDLSTDDGRAKFKYLFDDFIVPLLKAGQFFTKDIVANGKPIGEKLADEYNTITSNNEFITSLMKGLDGDVPLWKTDINMAADNSYTALKLSKFGKALSTLHTVKIGDYSLADWFAIYNFIVNKNRYGSDRLTKAFESFINTFNGKKDSVINDYFAFVGDLDYKGENVLNEFGIHIYDMLMQSARTVDSLETATGLMVVKDLTYYIKSGQGPGEYREFGKIAQVDSSSQLRELLNKYLIRRSYYTLSKPYTEFVNRIKYLLDGEKSAYKAFVQLMLRGNLKININCQ